VRGASGARRRCAQVLVIGGGVAGLSAVTTVRSRLLGARTCYVAPASSTGAAAARAAARRPAARRAQPPGSSCLCMRLLSRAPGSQTRNMGAIVRVFDTRAAVAEQA